MSLGTSSIFGKSNHGGHMAAVELLPYRPDAFHLVSRFVNPIHIYIILYIYNYLCTLYIYYSKPMESGVFHIKPGPSTLDPEPTRVGAAAVPA